MEYCVRGVGRVTVAHDPPEAFVIGFFGGDDTELWPGGPAVRDPLSWDVRMLDSDIL